MVLGKHLKDLGITKELIEESVDKFGPELARIGLTALITSRLRSKFTEDFIKEAFPKADLETLDSACYWLTNKEKKEMRSVKEDKIPIYICEKCDIFLTYAILEDTLSDEVGVLDWHHGGPRCLCSTKKEHKWKEGVSCPKCKTHTLKTLMLTEHQSNYVWGLSMTKYDYGDIPLSDEKYILDCDEDYLKDKIRLAVVGSRTFTDYEEFKNTLDDFLESHTATEIISGGAKGADTFAERYAKENGIPTNIILPNWEKFGKSAGFIRNEQIVKECTYLMAFWDGKSKGTKHSIDLAKKYKKPYLVWRF